MRLRWGDDLSEMILITFRRCTHNKVWGGRGLVGGVVVRGFSCSRPTELAIEIQEWDECAACRQGLSN